MLERDFLGFLVNLAHFAFGCESRAEVDRLTDARSAADPQLAALGAQLALSGILLGLAGPSINTDGGTLALMVLWFAIRALLRLAVYIFIGALILQAVLSWINPYSPLAAPAYQLTRPILDPIRRIMPTISGIDLSPLVAILLLQVVLMFL